tara:strand:- start:91 stop:780 length:690 start_codon:yes stop_codon:yes gene_type:complete
MPDEQTSLCFITLDQSGERSFTHRGGDPFGALSKADLDMDVIKGSRAIVFSCGALRSTASYAAVKQAVAGATGLICCDPGGFPRAWGVREEIHERIVEVASQCHIFKCSKDEGALYFGEAQPQMAVQKILNRGARLAVVTDGENGAYYATRKQSGHVAAPEVTVVDTTGAGDAFMAGLIFGLTRDESPEIPDEPHLRSIISFACRAGADAVTQLGAVNEPPSATGTRPL